MFSTLLPIRISGILILPLLYVHHNNLSRLFLIWNLASRCKYNDIYFVSKLGLIFFPELLQLFNFNVPQYLSHNCSILSIRVHWSSYDYNNLIDYIAWACNKLKSFDSCNIRILYSSSFCSSNTYYTVCLIMLILSCVTVFVNYQTYYFKYLINYLNFILFMF